MHRSAELFADDRDGGGHYHCVRCLGMQSSSTSARRRSPAKITALKGPPLAALLSLIKYAGELREPGFSINLQQWRKMSGIAGNETLLAACTNFEDTVSIHFESGAHHATASLLNLKPDARLRKNSTREFLQQSGLKSKTLYER